MHYRCPTCKTKYSIADKGLRGPLYIKCQVCGFLIEATANAIKDEQAASKNGRPKQRSRYLSILALLIALFGLAWALATAIR